MFPEEGIYQVYKPEPFTDMWILKMPFSGMIFCRNACFQRIG